MRPAELGTVRLMNLIADCRTTQGRRASGVATAPRTETPDPINLGSGHEISIKDLAQKIADHVGYRGKLVFDPTQPDGQPRRCLDVSRAKNQVGFVAGTSLEDGLRKTIEWYESQNRA